MQITREIRVHWGAEPQAYTEPVLNSWAGWPSQAAMGSPVAIRATVEGEVDPRIGYTCNVKDIDRLVRGAIQRLSTQRATNPHAIQWTKQLVEELTKTRGDSVWIIAVETALSAQLRMRIRLDTPHMVTITQQYEFSAAHRLHCESMSDEENRQLFGKCNNRHGHGHNYVLDVELECDANENGRALSLAKIDAIVQCTVIDRFDHKNLNVDTPEFSQLNPTVENIATTIFHLLRGRFENAALARVRVYETPKSWADVTA